MKRPRILLDVDGPLTESFLNDMVLTINDYVGTNHKAEDVRHWNIFDSFDVPLKDQKIIEESLRHLKGWAQTFTPREGAREFVEELRTWADVIAVTAPLDGSPTWSHDRETWLQRELGFSLRDIALIRRKELLPADAFIDDRVSQVIAWRNHHPNGLGIVWRMPYNDGFQAAESYDGFQAAESYDDLRKALKCLTPFK